MKKLIIFLFAFALLIVTSQSAHACEPCFKILSLEETAEAADLVIIGKLAKEGPSTGDYPQGGPDWIEIQVLETLKGEPKGKKIRVNSWDGMCAYGIIIEDKRDYLIFLVEGEVMYKAVEIGCSAGQYPMEDGMVEMEEKESVALDDLVMRLRLERREVEEKDGGPMPPCGLAGMGVIVIGMIFVRRRKN